MKKTTYLKTRPLIYPVVLLWVLSCGKKSKQDSAKPDAAASAASDEASFIPVTEKLTPVEGQPNVYAFELTWSGGETYSEIQVTRSPDKIAKEVVAASSAVGSYSAKDLAGGSSWTYEIVGKLNGESYSLHKTSFTVPKDLVASESTPLTTSFVSPQGRLFFPKGSTLRTEGKNLKIEVKSVIVEDIATVDTAPRSAAEPGKSGASGGLLFAKIGELKGNLKVLSRGQEGGKGSRGVGGDYGRDGENGSLDNSYPTAGTDGTPGTNGGQGGSGLYGGDSAIVRVEVENLDAGKIEVVVLGGTGGAGGDGGPAGGGGPGGKGGTGMRGNKMANGKNGLDGVPGHAGPQGMPGRVLDYCVIVANKNIEGNCERVPQSFFSNIQ